MSNDKSFDEDCLEHCKYIPQEDQRSDNQLKTNNELSFSEKTQVALVDWLLSQPDLEYEEFDKAENLERENFKLTQSIQEKSEAINHLTVRITQLHTRIYQLEQENKQLKNSQLEAEPKPIVISYQ
jgi:cell shape-determining protein MreC